MEKSSDVKGRQGKVRKLTKADGKPIAIARGRGGVQSGVKAGLTGQYHPEKHGD
jgi:hypothetical protein